MRLSASDRNELCARILTCIEAGAIEQARIIARRIQQSEGDCPAWLWAKIPTATILDLLGVP